jgi:hypothetical protein
MPVLNIPVTLLVIILSLGTGYELYKYLTYTIEIRKPLTIAKYMQRNGEEIPSRLQILD